MNQQRTADSSTAPLLEVGAPAQPRARRGVRIAKRAFRIIRNLLAILGICFAYLLWVGFMQYQDRADAGDTACSFTHCM
ncbi:hypothetical protein [Caballeronia sordidicola]|uniref:Uncharacterized protein n=1 Tax=Caballeronia sordidicola TaxID=196367 RepID=A0A242N7R5_CABSO|nr:hypothetical protein [Caballeronia sordidicola]OTP79454.1 hypothetical protein PAMC26577_00905 [Caballeronia sordidicola]